MQTTRFHKKTIKDIPLQGKTILLRADYNVPLRSDGSVAGDNRIIQSIPTLQYLLEKKCKVIVISHLGRPAGKPNKKESLENVAKSLQKHLPNTPVQFHSSTIDDSAKIACKKMLPASILVLENLRFHPGEEENDMEFARSIAKTTKADYFVQDGFGVVHRAHASTDAITYLLPSVAGLLLEREVVTLKAAMDAPKHPVTAIVGGAKISDKIDFIHKLLGIADTVLIGGAMANTFLAAMGTPIGLSRTEDGQEEAVQAIMKKAKKDQIVLPVDVGVATSISENAARRDIAVKDVAEKDYILDLGPRTAKEFCAQLQASATVIWNGTLGMTELPQFATCSSAVAKALAGDSDVTSIIGGGDTADFVLDWQEHAKEKGAFTHISTGGGASLELMSGLKLPGVEALIG